jgi:hypothetical protein
MTATSGMPTIDRSGAGGDPSTGNRGERPSLTGGASDPGARPSRPEPDDVGSGRYERQTPTSARADEP